MKRCEAAPYFFRDPVTDVCVEAHMDDFFMTGPTSEAEAFIDKLTVRMRIKKEEPSGPGSTRSHLRKRRTWTPSGITTHSDERRLVKLQRIIGLANCNPKPVPATKDLLRETPSNDKELGAVEAGLY